MNLKDLYREIVNEHNLHPEHKYELENASTRHNGVNPSCGDDVTLEIRYAPDGTIEEASYVGSGCAVSQASADMMIDLITGKTKEEALHLADIFTRMIHQEASEEEMEELEEAAALADVSHMPSRVKCALLGWRTMKEILTED